MPTLKPKLQQPVLFSDGRRIAVQKSDFGLWRTLHSEDRRFDVFECDRSVLDQLKIVGDPISPKDADDALIQKLSMFAIRPVL